MLLHKEEMLAHVYFTVTGEGRGGGGSIAIKAIKLSGIRLNEEVTHTGRELKWFQRSCRENLCKRSTAFGLMKWKSWELKFPREQPNQLAIISRWIFSASRIATRYFSCEVCGFYRDGPYVAEQRTNRHSLSIPLRVTPARTYLFPYRRYVHRECWKRILMGKAYLHNGCLNRESSRT